MLLIPYHPQSQIETMILRLLLAVMGTINFSVLNLAIAIIDNFKKALGDTDN